MSGKQGRACPIFKQKCCFKGVERLLSRMYSVADTGPLLFVAFLTAGSEIWDGKKPDTSPR